MLEQLQIGKGVISYTMEIILKSGLKSANVGIYCVIHFFQGNLQTSRRQCRDVQQLQTRFPRKTVVTPIIRNWDNDKFFRGKFTLELRVSDSIR